MVDPQLEMFDTFVDDDNDNAAINEEILEQQQATNTDLHSFNNLQSAVQQASEDALSKRTQSAYKRLV